MLRLPITLRNKVILLTASLVFFATALVGLLNFIHTSRIALDTAIEGIAGETRLTAVKFVDGYHELFSDINLIAETPAVKDMVRHSANEGLDPMGRTTTDQWRERLVSVFVTVLRSRPHYTQLRYIGVANDGREIVRVNQFKGQIEIVPNSRLQQKNQEDYFKAGLKMVRKEVYFSEVTLNREFGEIDPNRIPTIRTVYPIYDDQGYMFGMIVLNADFS